MTGMVPYDYIDVGLMVLVARRRDGALLGGGLLLNLFDKKGMV